MGKNFSKLKKDLRGLKLATVCEEARLVDLALYLGSQYLCLTCLTLVYDFLSSDCNLKKDLKCSGSRSSK